MEIKGRRRKNLSIQRKFTVLKCAFLYLMQGEKDEEDAVGKKKRRRMTGGKNESPR